MLILKTHLNKNLFLLLTLLLIYSCTTEYESWQNQAIEYVKSETDINQKEYDQLVQIIQANPENFKIFINDDNSLDHEKIHENLIKLFASRKLAINPEKIFSPDNAFRNSEVSKFNVNVFLENSASMDGYVKGKTDFETAIKSMIGEIKISGICDSLNLSYINNVVNPFKGTDFSDFTDNLEQTSLIKIGGNRSESILSDVIKKAVSKVDDRNACILISDFVFSPGNQNHQDVAEYLKDQKIEIKHTFDQLVKNQNIAAIVLHLESFFDGKYYDKSNNIHNFTGKRPYYIWIFGTYSQIKQILSSNILENIEGGYLNQFILYKVEESNSSEYKIAKSPKIGNFKLTQAINGAIESAEADVRENGKFSFTFYANFADEIHDSEFYLDKNNYRYNNNYNLEISLVPDNPNAAMTGYTHIFTATTSELKSETFILEVIGRAPGWIDSISSENDINIDEDNEQASKTFGFNYLIEGMTSAFYPKNQEKILNRLEITIKR